MPKVVEHFGLKHEITCRNGGSVVDLKTSKAGESMEYVVELAWSLIVLRESDNLQYQKILNQIRNTTGKTTFTIW